MYVVRKLSLLQCFYKNTQMENLKMMNIFSRLCFRLYALNHLESGGMLTLGHALVPFLLKMSRRNSFYFEILGRVSRQLENFGSQILKNCSAVDGRSSSNSSVRRRPRFEMSVDSSNGELETGLG